MAQLGFERKQLGQLRPSDTTVASVYSPGTDVVAQIWAIVVCNTSGGTATYQVFHDEDGTTYDETTALFFNVDLAMKLSAVLTFGINDAGGIWMNDSTGNLAVQTGTGNALTFTVYGEEHLI